jgi:hypothetical protein
MELLNTAPVWVTLVHVLIVSICAWYDPSLLNLLMFRGVISLFLVTGSIFTLFVCSSTDPGFLNESVVVSRELGRRQVETELASSVKEDTDPESHELRFCNICEVYQPLRSKHCPELNRCVRTHDHYCQWIGNCVGENNRSMFLMYLCLETGALAWFTTNAFMKIAKHAGINQKEIAAFTALVFAITLMSIFLLMTSMLTCYHFFLAAANLTTWEQSSWQKITYLKDLQPARGSPFSTKSIIGNMKQYFRYPGSVQLDSEGGIVWRLGMQHSVLPEICMSCCEA